MLRIVAYRHHSGSHPCRCLRIDLRSRFVRARTRPHGTHRHCTFRSCRRHARTRRSWHGCAECRRTFPRTRHRPRNSGTDRRRTILEGRTIGHIGRSASGRWRCPHTRDHRARGRSHTGRRRMEAKPCPLRRRALRARVRARPWTRTHSPTSRRERTLRAGASPTSWLPRKQIAIVSARPTVPVEPFENSNAAARDVAELAARRDHDGALGDQVEHRHVSHAAVRRFGR